MCTEMLFDLIGIEFAKEGKKATSFGRVVNALGVELDLCGEGGEVFLGHTSKRKDEFSTALDSLLSSRRVETKFAESCRGRMQWFEGFVFGRTERPKVC